LYPGTEAGTDQPNSAMEQIAGEATTMMIGALLGHRHVPASVYAAQETPADVAKKTE
jgi:hypothetical protein